MQDNQETKTPQGEKVEEINSEITEIIGMQKMAASCETEFASVQAYDALNGKIATHIRSRAKDGKHEKDLVKLDDINYAHRNDTLETIKSETRVKDWISVIFMQIGNDITTRCIVPSENYRETSERLERLAYSRLKVKRYAQYMKLMAIISDEFDLHKDLTSNKKSQEEFEGKYFNE